MIRCVSPNARKTQKENKRRRKCRKIRGCTEYDTTTIIEKQMLVTKKNTKATKKIHWI